MPIFIAKHKKITKLIRAKCLTCARQFAVDTCGDEGTLVWRDPEQSTVEHVRESGKTQIIAVQYAQHSAELDDDD